MDAKLIDQIKSTDDYKLDLVKQIIKHHPGYGVKRGYSWYVGGMGDHGEWNLDVLLSTRDKELNIFLDFLKEEERKAAEQRKELDRISKLPEEEQRMHREENWKKEKEARKKWNEDFQMRLIWGNGK